jgi:hypothetical protein
MHHQDRRAVAGFRNFHLAESRGQQPAAAAEPLTGSRKIAIEAMPHSHRAGCSGQAKGEECTAAHHIMSAAMMANTASPRHADKPAPPNLGLSVALRRRGGNVIRQVPKGRLPT